MRKLSENNDLTCLRCKYIEQDIINSVQSSNEYKRSLAISEAFNFLLNKLKIIDETNKELNTNENTSQEYIRDLKNEINKHLKVIELNADEFEQKQFLLTNKLDTMTFINKNLESKLKGLEEKIKIFVINTKEKEIQNENILSEFKQSNYKCVMDNENLDRINKQLELQLENNKTNLNTYTTEINKMKDKEALLNKKLKELEVLMYKLDLENQDFRHIIRSANRKQGETIETNISKIDVVNELQSIENTIWNKNTIDQNFLTINTNESLIKENNFKITTGPIGKFSNKRMEEMNIEDVASEIKKTENDLKNYSFSLKANELSILDNIVDPENSKNDNKDLMKILEEKAEYLYELKKRYNQLYKKINNLN